MDRNALIDPVPVRAGRLSHAVRHQFPAWSILEKRRELSAAKIERILYLQFRDGVVPTLAEAKRLSKLMVAMAKDIDAVQGADPEAVAVA